jgi:hypothetical protein
MRKVFHFFVPLVLFLGAFLACSRGALAQVLINEFVADPAKDWDGDGVVSSRDDEWIEIINLGSNPVDLAGYRLTDSEGPRVWRCGFAGALDPGRVRIVYGSDAKAWEEANKFPAYGLHLNNTGDRPALYRIVGTDTTLVDSYAYTEASTKDDRAIGRRPDSPSVWVIFDGRNPCSSSCDPQGTGCMPTPGARNTCATPTRSESWGRIKSVYR